jgi:hypothetical protein
VASHTAGAAQRAATGAPPAAAGTSSSAPRNPAPQAATAQRPRLRARPAVAAAAATTTRATTVGGWSARRRGRVDGGSATLCLRHGAAPRSGREDRARSRLRRGRRWQRGPVRRRTGSARSDDGREGSRWTSARTAREEEEAERASREQEHPGEGEGDVGDGEPRETFPAGGSGRGEGREAGGRVEERGQAESAEQEGQPEEERQEEGASPGEERGQGGVRRARAGRSPTWRPAPLASSALRGPEQAERLPAVGLANAVEESMRSTAR